jgi:AraC family transcriptional activator FtrA
LEYALVDGKKRSDVSGLARHLGVSPRTLAQHLHDEGLSETRKLLMGCLVLRAANYLCHTEQTVEAVAERLDLSGAHTLRRIFRRYLGITPRDLVDPLQWKGVVQTFVRSL